jgi:hypothetical protein
MRVDDELERRLRALAETGTPDWGDVRRRARPARAPRRRVLAMVLAGAVLLLAAAAALGVGSRVLDLLSLSQSDKQVPGRTPVAYVAGDRLHLAGRKPIPLAAPLFAPLLGQDVPLAIGSPDGRGVAYHASRGGHASLRIVDTRSGEDRLLARDAQSIAWGDRLAYVAGVRKASGGGEIVGRVVVADRPFGRAVAWTTDAAEYRVAAWAGPTLLVEVDDCHVPPCAGRPAGGAYALNGPGRVRPLSIDSVAAVSPDGRYAIGPYLPVPGQDSPSPIVHVDDVRTGRTVASIDLVRAARGKAPARWLAGGTSTPAAWRGGKIVGVSSVGSISVLFVLGFEGRDLRLERVLRLDPATRADPGDALFFSSPRFAGPGTGRVLVALRGPLGRGGYLATTLACDLARRHCARGRPLTRRRWSALVGNPSRP